MTTTVVPVTSRGFAPMLRWPRVRFTVLLSLAMGLLVTRGGPSGLLSSLLRAVLLGLTLMLVYGLFEQWPRRLPRWIARWVLQVVGVAAAVPIATALLFWLTNDPGAPAFYHVPERMRSFSRLCMVSLLVAPWVALGALVRQREALAKHQALAFELERSELERRAADARLRLLQAQVAPHFLFNTLANVQALVDAGSPRASDVLRSLIAYLRAAVPRLDEPASTLGQELELVRAYLELMHMRMPDRLQFTLHVDDAARTLRCPPLTLLTLVENAVRHGIDPTEEGGRVDIHAHRQGERCILRVSDTGAGLSSGGAGLGTGLTTLRERLELAFAGDARVRVSAQHPRGVTAEVDFPALDSAA